MACSPPSSTSLTSSIPELAPHIHASSSSTLSQLLTANHASHHCFFNTRGMHNHSAHQLIAALTLGATPTQLQRHYDYQIQHYLGDFSYNDRSTYDPYHPDFQGKQVEKIGEENWTKHLGNARFYWSYLGFFDGQVEKLGFKGVLDKYVLSEQANEGRAAMLVRFYGGVLHAWIHFGYALELGWPGLAGEALAMASATGASHAWLFQREWLFNPPSVPDCKPLLELVREVQNDKRLSVESLGLKDDDSALPDQPFDQGVAKGVIQSYVDRWSGIGDFDQALAELSLFSALLLGAVPKQQQQGNGAYKHDFFLMHLNNAHLFTPLFLDLLKGHRREQTALLRGLLAQFLYYYVCRGSPPFRAENWTQQRKANSVLEWADMFSEASDNVDEHLPKAVRSLYVFESRYSHHQRQLVGSDLLPDNGLQDVEDSGGGASIWKCTASQLVRMHRGELQKSKYDEAAERNEGESVGAHQEFWSFEPFF